MLLVSSTFDFHLLQQTYFHHMYLQVDFEIEGLQGLVLAPSAPLRHVSALLSALLDLLHIQKHNNGHPDDAVHHASIAAFGQLGG